MSMLADRLQSDPILCKKADFFEKFWKGEGAYPILFAKPHFAIGRNYRQYNLMEQHADVEKLLSEAVALARIAMERPDDGIPLARADLGTTLFSSGLGLGIRLGENEHPWLSEHLELSTYANLSGIAENFPARGEVPLATAFYRRLLEERKAGRIPKSVLPYLPDNQGVFDLTHLAVGSDLFYAFADFAQTVLTAQERSLELYLAGSRHFKALINEDDTCMVHGHGMPAGVWFPDTGIRISEDSCTLISRNDIETYCMPFIDRAIRPFGRGFMHFCGHHEDFIRVVMENPLISTINLGNPESYDLEEVFSYCGRTGTVYFGHLPKNDKEDDETWLERLADLCGRTSCRLILVAAHAAADHGEEDGPGAYQAQERMVNLWHKLTRRNVRVE